MRMQCALGCLNVGLPQWPHTGRALKSLCQRETVRWSGVGTANDPKFTIIIIRNSPHHTENSAPWIYIHHAVSRKRVQTYRYTQTKSTYPFQDDGNTPLSHFNHKHALMLPALSAYPLNPCATPQTTHNAHTRSPLLLDARTDRLKISMENRFQVIHLHTQTHTNTLHTLPISAICLCHLFGRGGCKNAPARMFGPR